MIYQLEAHLMTGDTILDTLTASDDERLAVTGDTVRLGHQQVLYDYNTPVNAISCPSTAWGGAAVARADVAVGC